MAGGLATLDKVTGKVHTPAAVVAAHGKFFEPEMAHHVDVVLRHAPVRVVAVVGQTARLAAVAVPAQIASDHREIFREAWRDQVPVHVRERVAVQKQQRRAIAADDAAYFHLRIAGLNVELPEAFEHGQLLGESGAGERRSYCQCGAAVKPDAEVEGAGAGCYMSAAIQM